MTYANSMRLSSLKKGDKVVLRKLEVAENVASHLMNLGLVPGTIMDILLRNFNGTIVMAKNGKFALGREIADALEVDVIHEQRMC